MIGLVLFSARADIVQRSKAESAVIVVFSEFFISNPFHLGHKKSIVALALTNENQSTIGQSFSENLDFFPASWSDYLLFDRLFRGRNTTASRSDQ